MKKKIYIKLKNEIDSNIFAEMAVEALIYEVKLSPKAGLVTINSNGSHKDMNFLTFEISAKALKNYFKTCIEHHRKYNINDEIFFIKLRELGKIAEKEMLEATKGINTHKGTIFSMGILLAVLFALFSKNKIISLDDLSEQIKKTCASLKDELGLSVANTNGEKIFQKYKIAGARGLALSGYELVLNDGLQKLHSFFPKLDLDTALILLLFYYISELNDTNIISRSNLETLKEAKIKAKILFEKNLKVLDERMIKEDMEELNRDFVKKNISPGGSADLLILTIFLFLLLK